MLLEKNGGIVMELSIVENDFLQSFEHIDSQELNNKNKMDIFMLNSNANEFDYKSLERNLLDPVITYSLSRKVQQRYKNSAATLSKKAREKFKEYSKNTGELGELMLYCFLERHLKAPKILSKLELKTSSQLYVNGSDGVHYLKLEDGNYQLIFGESKMYQDLGTAIERALESIRQFKEEVNQKGEEKSGITFEKNLISDNLQKEFDEEDEKFLTKLIYPTSESNFFVDDAFGIFIGYETVIAQEEKQLSNSEFRKIMKQKILDEISKISVNINTKIESKKLIGHNFYIYIVPFTEIEKERVEILGEILSWI